MNVKTKKSVTCNMEETELDNHFKLGILLQDGKITSKDHKTAHLEISYECKWFGKPGDLKALTQK